MKKIIPILVLLILTVPFIVSAGTYRYIEKDDGTETEYDVCYEGFIPCGHSTIRIQPAGNPVVDANGECIGVLCPNTVLGNPNWCTGAVCPPELNSNCFIPCAPCHILVMVQGIINFILLIIIPPIAVLMFVAGGVALFQAGQNVEKARLAKNILTTAVIGLVIIYGSWLIINSILTAVGVAEWAGLDKWFEIPCEVTVKRPPYPGE